MERCQFNRQHYGSVMTIGQVAIALSKKIKILGVNV